MFKKIVTGAVMAGLLAISSAGAAQVAPRNAPGGAATAGGAAAAGGSAFGIATPALLAVFAALSASLIFFVEENEENDETPVSP